MAPILSNIAHSLVFSRGSQGLPGPARTADGQERRFALWGTITPFYYLILLSNGWLPLFSRETGHAGNTEVRRL